MMVYLSMISFKSIRDNPTIIMTNLNLEVKRCDVKIYIQKKKMSYRLLQSPITNI